MRIALFGGTGKAGSAILEEALTQGHQVRALVRNPSNIRRPGLEVVQGGFADTAALDHALEGAEVAITAIGITSKARPTLLEDSVTAIRAGMRRAGVGRLIVVQGAHLPFPGDPRNPGLLLLKAILGVVMRPVVLDGHRLVTLLQADDCDWTVIRMPPLKVAPATGAMEAGTLRINPLKHVTSGDVAVLALQCSELGTYVKEMPMITSGRPRPAAGKGWPTARDGVERPTATRA
jgi:methylmalonyl-CoA mutase cobalamin-binding subunit